MARTRTIGKGAKDARTATDYTIPSMPGWGERHGNIATAIAPDSFAGYLQDSERGNLGQLYEIYDKMDTDLQVGGLTDQIIRTLAGATLKVELPESATSGEKATAEEYLLVAKDVLASMNTRSLIRSFARSGLRGLGVFHVEYAAEKRGMKYLSIPKNIKLVSGQRYRWEREISNPRWGEIKIATSNRSDGIFLSDMPQDQLFHIAESNELGRWDLNGIYRRAAGWWLLKSYASSWWADRVEVYGEPIRIGRYPQGTKTETKNEVVAFLADMGRTSYALLPDSVNLQILDQQQGSGGISSHKELIEYIDNRLAFTFLGQTDSATSARYGSKARSETVVGVTYDMLQDHGAIVSEGFRSMLCAVIKRNYGMVEARLVPKVSLIIVNPTVAASQADKFVQMGQAGIPVKAELIYEQTGTAAPVDGDLVFVNGSFAIYKSGVYKSIDPNAEESDKLGKSAGDRPKDGGEDDQGANA